MPSGWDASLRRGIQVLGVTLGTKLSNGHCHVPVAPSRIADVDGEPRQQPALKLPDAPRIVKHLATPAASI
eukprot:6844001-Pyramimonas_sp.AAC.1